MTEPWPSGVHSASIKPRCKPSQCKKVSSPIRFTRLHLHSFASRHTPSITEGCRCRNGKKKHPCEKDIYEREKSGGKEGKESIADLVEKEREKVDEEKGKKNATIRRR